MRKVGDGRNKLALIGDVMDERNFFFLRQRQIFGAKRGRDVHDAGAVVHRDKVGCIHLKRMRLVLVQLILKIIERRLVALADEFFAKKLSDYCRRNLSRGYAGVLGG